MSGRWPPNLLLTHSVYCSEECHQSCPVRLLDEQAGPRVSSWGGPKLHKSESGGYGGGDISGPVDHDRYKDGTNVSRFFPIFSWTEEDFLT